VPARVPAAGTFSLTYPVEPTYVGGGLGFSISGSGCVQKVKLNGGVAADYATLYGYAY
jgi:hypothetical protein